MSEATVFYRPKQLADRFGVSPQCVRVWECTGKISPAVRTMGGHRRFTEDHVRQINAMIDQQMTPTLDHEGGVNHA